MTVTLDNPGKEVLKPRSLAHVVLKTQPSQFSALVQFYKTFLGAHATYENAFLAFLTYDSEHHRIAIGVFPNTGPKVPTSSGLAHIAFAFDNLSDLALAYRQRKAHGITPFWCINHGPTTSMYYKDPDGNEIETQVDNFDSVEEIDAFMRSQAFADNPIGTEFDPEELIRRLEAGEDHRSIKKRIEIGKRQDIPA